MNSNGRPRITDAHRVNAQEHPLALEGQECALPDTPPPEHLNETAAECWRQLLPLLCAQGLAAVDLHLVESYCTTYAKMRVAEEDIETAGQVLFSGKGLAYANPSVKIAKDMVAALGTIGKSIGISAQARSRIKVKPKPSAAKNALQAFRESPGTAEVR